MKQRSIAVVGAAETTKMGKIPDVSVLGLHGDAALNAMADAGLKPSDIDGVATAGESPVQVANYLGITPTWVDGTSVGGCSFMLHVRHAAAAINAGSGRNSATESKFPLSVLTRNFDYGAEMHIIMKDIDLAIAQGEDLGVPMWVCQAARLMFKHAMFKGAAKDDLTTIVKHVEGGAGFQIPRTR